MDKTHIIALVKNILNEIPKTLVTDVQIPKLSPCSLCDEEPRCPVYRCNKDIETTLSPSETELQEDPMELSPQMTEASCALQNKDAFSSAKNAIEPTSEICSKCSEAISPELSKPVVLLT
ncbi:1172_t:CDS:2, partial [Diversispora eburnea]